jgi:hypothetical protein
VTVLRLGVKGRKALGFLSRAGFMNKRDGHAWGRFRGLGGRLGKSLEET